MKNTLSNYYPENTEYFYSYPAGGDSNFFNNVDPTVEELVAARLLVCAGEFIKVVVFAATQNEQLMQFMRNDLGVSLIDPKNIITLPKEITASICGVNRNELVKKALKNITKFGQLIMAQPFLQNDLKKHYQIDPETSIWLNDKHNMPEYISEQYLPKRYATFTNGEAFCSSDQTFPIPCVIKISSSSSGDGVWICHDVSQFAEAKAKVSELNTTIYVEQYIDIVKNFGVQFGIPADQSKPIDIIGYDEQQTTDQGEFLGGLINPHQQYPVLDEVYQLLLEDVLPKIREKGWYGIGGFDVLIDANDSFYIVDSNFRATGLTPYFFLVKNKIIKNAMISFAGTFCGTINDLKERIAPFAKQGAEEQILQVVSLTQDDRLFRINGAVLFDNNESLMSNARRLLDLGIDSSVLREHAQVIETEEIMDITGMQELALAPEYSSEALATHI